MIKTSVITDQVPPIPKSNSDYTITTIFIITILQ